MTISPMATAVPVPAVPAGTGEAAPAPTDFLAALLAAASAEEGALAPARLVEEGALPPVRLVEEGALAPVRLVEDGALAPARLVEEGALAPVSKPGDSVADQPPHPAEESPALLDPSLASLLVQQSAAIPRLDNLDVGGRPDTRLVEEGALAPVPTPGEPTATTTPELAVAGEATPSKEHTSVPAEVAPLPSVAANPSATANPAQQPVMATAPAASTAPPLVANTAPLDRVSAQVFPEVTGLVSRGNGSHRITLTLNPEQLGEVRVVMTMRDGAVHVRMAAGHEARAALLEGSAELSRLLEATGATETRIVVRELPAAAVSATNPTPNSPGSLLGGDGAPDQRAGTHADHQARDGSDPSTPQPARADGATSPGHAPRSNQSVTGTRAAGVDLTM